MNYSFLPEEGHLYTCGRTFYADGKLHLTWIGTSVTFVIRGTDWLLISIDRYDCDRDAYLKITADGRPQIHSVSKGTGNIVVRFGSGTCHRVTVQRITESVKDVVISRISLYGKEPEVLVKPPVAKTKIEFVGDSLTAGYGNLGEASTTVYYPYEQDCTQAYSGLTAEMLDLEYRIEAVSGKGLSHNWDGSTEFLIPEFFRYTSPETLEEWDFSKWAPDIAVIYAGTNDASSRTPENEVIPAAQRFIKFVRQCYPDATIVYVYGSMEKSLAPAIRKTVIGMAQSDPKLFYFEFGDVYGKPDELGANGHPNVKSHQRAAKELCTFLLNSGIVSKK